MAFVASILMLGCGDGQSLVDNQAPDAGTTQVAQGVTITKQTEMDLRVVAASGEAKVTITVHRLGLRNPETMQDPSIQSPYDSDIIVRNRYGFPFVTSGNHGLPNDPDTGNMSMESPKVVNQQQQIEDLQLTTETVVWLQESPGIIEPYGLELRSLYYMVGKAQEGANDIIDGRAIPEPAPQANLSNRSIQSSGEDIAVARQAYTAPYTHEISIQYNPIWWTAWKGDHSAVLLWVFDSVGYFVGMVSTRNHGLEASDPAMWRVASGCPRTWTGRANAMPPLQPYFSTDTYLDGDAGGCSTPYSISGASYTHVCNDDSLAMYQSVKNNASQLWTTCSDNWLRKVAPYCD